MPAQVRAKPGFADNSRAVVVAFPGEVDFESVGRAREELLVLLNRGAKKLILDFTGTRFCDSSGINAVFRVHHRARVLGAYLRLAVPLGSPVRRAFGLIRMETVIPVLPSVQAARDDLALLPDHAAGRTPPT